MSKRIEGRPKKGLNILCIDGGGIGGLSSLLLLKEVMLRVQKLGGHNKPVKPCEYFDIIAGAGTGGLAACILGRLRMSIDEAIESFEWIMREIFSAKKLFGTGAFKSTTLREAIIKVIRKATGNGNERMLEEGSGETSSKTMVFAMSKHNMAAELPIIFRSYETFSNAGPDCTIWQAICATMAHPSLFKSFDIPVGTIVESFVDAGVKCSNPLAHVLSENVGLSEWEDLGQVAAHTRAYLARTETMNRLDKAGKAVRQRRAIVAAASIDGQVHSGTVSRMVLKRYPAPTPIFGGREDEIKHVLDCLTSERPERRVCVVYGLGGAGKTQLVLKAIERSEDQWSVVIHVDSSSQTSIKDALQQFASAMAIGETHGATIEWLESQREQWLLVFDGADKPGIELPNYFPKGNHGRIIITTRRGDLKMYAQGPNSTHDVTRMREDEALELLVKLAYQNNKPVLSNQIDAANLLLEEFECFALAIVQAGAYICHANIEFSRYKKLFLARKKDTLEQFNKLADKPDGYSKTVYTTWIMCYDLISPDAQ
ncbi:unnamed protein product [Rhizoctonia solani]|uniref:PNPLA domain-containing protein n=1 Tax=Rhizoctonia solani TaxID=456999 RepID=A0A8H3GVC9_9AGAM|nr:unnamed protein product [Rhizoctonia solani]